MRAHHVDFLACINCRSALRVGSVEKREAEHILDGTLQCTHCSASYPVVGGVPRFVPRENYAAGFGLEWTRHARTQYDSYSGIPVSERRFFEQTRWPRQMSGQRILEVGSGSGRFTEQAARTGATVVSLDYSYAVEANFASNAGFENVLIVQADVFDMPFAPATFDRLFCFGMLQHTPDAERAFLELPKVVKPGGAICADSYKATLLRTLLQTKYYVRPFTRQMDPEKLYGLVTRWVDFMWPIASVIRRFPKGHAINWRLLVADYSALGLRGEMLKEWAYLDTFDMLAPRYDRPQRLSTIRQWGQKAGLEQVEVEFSGHGITLRGVVRDAASPMAAAG